MSRRLLAGVVIAFVMATPLLFGWSEQRPLAAPSADILGAAEAVGLQSQMLAGDLLFRRGSGRYSAMFAGSSGPDGYFSHVGLVVRENGQWQVLHAEADEDTGIGGVRSDSIERFLTGAAGFALVRLDLDVDQRARLLALAPEPRWRRIPFDARFRLDDDGTSMYCTELVWAMVKESTGIDLVPFPTVFAGMQVLTIDDLRHADRARTIIERRLN